MLGKIRRIVSEPIWSLYRRIKKSCRFLILSFTYKKTQKRLRSVLDSMPIRVGFIGYADGASCDVFTNLYREFEKDSRFICSVIILPYTHDDKRMMIQKHRNAMNYVKGQGISPLPGYDETHDCFVNYHGKFDLVFFENEYDWVDPIFKVENFRDALSFVIPYGQYLADNIQQHLSYKMMSEVYRVYPTSKPVALMMRKYSEIYGMNINRVYLGNPKIDGFFFDDTVNNVWLKAKEGQKRIIWAPHHTWAPYSNFLTYYRYFLDYAKIHKNVFIAIKPHPALKDSLREINGWTDSEIKEYFNEWRDGINTDLFEGEWFDLFKSSDAMILDSIGFMLEYSLTGKPACVLYRIDEEGNRVMKFSECGEVLYEQLYHAKNINEIESFIDMISRNEDYNLASRDNFIRDNYTPPYGKSGAKNIYENILSLLTK